MLEILGCSLAKMFGLCLLGFSNPPAVCGTSSLQLQQADCYMLFSSVYIVYFGVQTVSAE